MDKALKQRLIGAVVLIALAVIVLPMIFGGRPAGDGLGPSEIELPTAPPDLDFETRRFPVGDQPVPEVSSPPPASATQEQTPVESPESDLTQPSPSRSPIQAEPSLEQDPVETEQAAELPSGVEEVAVPEQDLPPPAAEAQTAVSQVTPREAAAASPLRYVVQVASFGSTQNATRLASQLEDAGYAVLLDHVSSETAQLNRVRVGPYGSEAAAQGVVRELRDRFAGINPRIVDLQPDQAAPAIASDDPLMRWVVQVGSFSSSENARNLVARLRLAGHSSYDETITNDTSTIYRVRVGPFLDRDEALRVEQQISDEMGIDSVVMSSD